MVQDRKKNFEEAAERRVNNVITSLVRLGHCSNKSRYSYSEEQVNKMFRAIRQELEKTKEKFQSKKNKEFKF